jgi:hypothetical protein
MRTNKDGKKTVPNRFLKRYSKSQLKRLWRATMRFSLSQKTILTILPIEEVVHR